MIDLTRWSSTGALTGAVAAAVSWICCLPILLGMTGVATSGTAWMLASWRPYINGLSLVLLAVAFYLAYFGEDCGTQSCQPGQQRRQRLVLWLAAFAVLGSLTFPRWASWIIYWSI